MVLGSEFRLPADLVFGLPEQDVRQSPSRYVLSLEDTLRECFQTARQTDSSNHVVQRDYHDRKALGAAFGEDDYVWLLDTVIPNGSGEKSSNGHGRDHSLLQDVDIRYTIFDHWVMQPQSNASISTVSRLAKVMSLSPIHLHLNHSMNP